jgi:NAD(P)H-hydrate epimerase
MKAVTAEEMRRIDRETIEVMGIPAGVLMAEAGKAVADFALTLYRGDGAVAVACGTGNNGGDGFVAAARLAECGVPVRVFLAGESSRVSPVAEVYLGACLNAGVIVTTVTGPDAMSAFDLKGCSLVIDALLGTGFEGTVRAHVAAIIEAVNASGIPVVSVDVPSGLPSDGQGPEGAAVRAAHTVTIGLPKLSLVTWPGREYAGEVRVADIGFPRRLLENDELAADLVDTGYVRARFTPGRGAATHKGEAGHLLFVGGFDCMEGAIMLGAMAAFETGVGLATVLTTETARPVIAGKIPELMTRPIRLSEGVAGAGKSVREFFSGGRRYDALVMGPGMGRSELSRAVFDAVIAALPESGIRRALIDGDGLYHLSEFLGRSTLPEGVAFVLTPHFGEASRLLGETVDGIKGNRIAAAARLASRTGAVALLKGPASIAADGRRLLVNTTGNPALATAGSGDVLSGIVGALRLRGTAPRAAAGIGAYLHGRSADLAVAASGVMVLRAGEIIGHIRKAMAEL